MRYLLSDIAKIVGGRLVGCDLEVASVATDSRSYALTPDTLFVAMRGVNHDAHDHLSEVEERGVKAFVVEHDIALSEGCGAVVVTGVESGNVIENCVLASADATPGWVSGHRVDRHFAGTGDLFASVLCGWLLRGNGLEDAVRKTVAFVCKTTAATARWQENGQDGIAFEPFLCELNEG